MYPYVRAILELRVVVFFYDHRGGSAVRDGSSRMADICRLSVFRPDLVYFWSTYLDSCTLKCKLSITS